MEVSNTTLIKYCKTLLHNKHKTINVKKNNKHQKKKYDYIKILYKSHKHGLWVLLNYPKVFMGLGHDLRF